MPQTKTEPQVFKYETPQTDGTGKVHSFLCRSDILSAGIQLVTDGGETNLHAHGGNDGFWFVLSGRARFYGEGDVVIADVGKHEGILIPRGFPYWFEKAGDEPLEIMRVGATAQNEKNERINYTPLLERQVGRHPVSAS
jgi:mannose-6-phosphate isomerase-like protein (cupin superfamily)